MEWFIFRMPLAFPAQAESQNLHIYRMNVESREIEQLTSLPGEEYSPAWSSDGERIAFSMDRATLYTMRADGSDLQAHLEDLPSADAPVWSPDGEWLAFHSTCPGEAIQSGDYTTCGLEEQWFIHLMRLADGHIESLTPLTSSIHNPASSPDGEWIAFSSRDGMIAPAALFRMCPDGSDAQPLTFDPTLEHFYPRWVNVPDMDWRPIFLLIPALIFVAVGWRRDS